MIELKGVSKSFRRDFYSHKFKALDDVNFLVKTGKLVGFLGANGAGKTTTMKIILNFIKPDSGEVLLGDNGKASYRDFVKKLGFLPERPYFYAALTGKEFIHYMASLHDMNSFQINNELKKWAERLKIDHALDRKLFNYSKGMLQRIGFVASLIHRPECLILDEPVSGLDPIGRKEMKDVMVELNGEGKTIFFSSHIVSDIEEICSEIIVLKNGQLIYQGGVVNLLEDEKGKDIEIVFKGDCSDIDLENLGKLIMIDNDRFKIITNVLQKNKIIQLLLENNLDILSLNEEKRTLEEIVYASSRSHNV